VSQDRPTKEAIEHLRAARLAFAQTFQPPRDEVTSQDLLLRQGVDGGVRAYIVVGVNGDLLALSRAGWELIMPRLLQLIYGGRVAEAMVAHTQAATAEMAEEEANLLVQNAMMRYGNAVQGPHPLEMELLPKGTTIAERRARQEVERHSPQALKARLRRKDRQ
jgi:hypothetical protein